MQEQHRNHHRAHRLNGGQDAAHQAAHNAAPALKEAKGEHRAQDNNAGQQQPELAAELHTLDVPRAEDQQHHCAANGHAPAGDGENMVLLHELPGGYGVKSEAHGTDKAPYGALGRHSQRVEVEVGHAGKSAQHH